MANPVKRSDPGSIETTPSLEKPTANSRLQAARTRSATVNFTPLGGLPSDVMSQLKKQLSVRDLAHEEKKKTPDRKIQRAASFSLNSNPSKNSYWETVYEYPFFKNDKQFDLVVTHVTNKLKSENLDRYTNGLFTLIKNAGYLVKQDESKSVNEAVRSCLNSRTIEITMPGIDIKKTLETLDLTLRSIEKELFP